MVDANKLKSLVDQHASGPSAAQLGMAPPSGEGDMDDDLDDEPADEEAPLDPAGKGAKMIEDWGEFGQTIKEEAGELHDLATDVGGNLMLKDVPDDALKEVGKQVDKMPDELSMGLAKYVSKLSPEDCEALATALAAEVGDKGDVKLLAAYLAAAGKYAGDEIDVDDDFNEPEEDEESDDAGDDNDEPDAGDEVGGESDPAAAE